jgi:hypothetical protein
MGETLQINKGASGYSLDILDLNKTLYFTDLHDLVIFLIDHEEAEADEMRHISITLETKCRGDV